MSLNRNTLKYIAILAMVSDHVALSFIPGDTLLYFLMRFIGRLTAPIMCFFISEGFYYTCSKWKYGVRLAAFALISQFAFTLFYNGSLNSLFFTQWSMIYTLLIGFCILCVYNKVSNKAIKWMAIAVLFAASALGDWMVFAPAFILCFHVLRDDNRKKYVTFSIIAAAMTAIGFAFDEIWHIGMFLVIPLLLLYDGSKGSDSRFHKWVFYVFYPLHLIVIAVFRWSLLG